MLIISRIIQVVINEPFHILSNKESRVKYKSQARFLIHSITIYHQLIHSITITISSIPLQSLCSSSIPLQSLFWPFHYHITHPFNQTHPMSMPIYSTPVYCTHKSKTSIILVTQSTIQMLNWFQCDSSLPFRLRCRFLESAPFYSMFTLVANLHVERIMWQSIWRLAFCFPIPRFLSRSRNNSSTL